MLHITSPFTLKTCFNLIALLLPASFSPPPDSLHLSLLLFLSCFTRWRSSCSFFFFTCDVKSASLLLKSFPFLPSLSLHLSSTLPSLFLIPSLPCCRVPSTYRFHLLPLTFTSLPSVFSFFLQLHWYHPVVFSSLFTSFDHHFLRHRSLLFLLSLSTFPPDFILLFLTHF